MIFISNFIISWFGFIGSNLMLFSYLAWNLGSKVVDTQTNIRWVSESTIGVGQVVGIGGVYIGSSICIVGMIKLSIRLSLPLDNMASKIIIGDSWCSNSIVGDSWDSKIVVGESW